ncbi:hypothetical protein H0X48_05305, partial [Candidatus Dependentiae bacterium]|nr:hypothetical protein [Candidatus Dependentiae bacterium]
MYQQSKRNFWFLAVVCLLALPNKIQAMAQESLALDNDSTSITTNKRGNCSPCLSRTTFVPRQPGTDQTLELTLTNYFLYHTQVPCRPIVFLSATPFYEQTTRDCDFGRYFLPDHKRSVTFEGNRLSIRPERRVYGALLYAQLDLEFLRPGTWLSINVTPLRVEHTLNLHADDATREELGSSNLKYGAVTNCKLTRTRIDDILVKFGFNVWQNDCAHVDFYSVFTFPTGKCRNARYLFEPTVGTVHYSSGFGLNADYILWNKGQQSLTIMGDANYRYSIAEDERRSFDFCHYGEWSRFLPVSKAGSSTTQPAINLFSPCVRVEPRSFVELWTALHYQYCNWAFEAGYDLWYRENERVYLRNNCRARKDLVIYDQADLLGCSTTPNTTTSTQVIDGDLNLCSAAAPQVITHKVFAAASYNYNWHTIPTMLGLGGSYEFSKHHGSRG